MLKVTDYDIKILNEGIKKTLGEGLFGLFGGGGGKGRIPWREIARNDKRTVDKFANSPIVATVVDPKDNKQKITWPKVTALRMLLKNYMALGEYAKENDKAAMMALKKLLEDISEILGDNSIIAKDKVKKLSDILEPEAILAKSAVKDDIERIADTIDEEEF